MSKEPDRPQRPGKVEALLSGLNAAFGDHLHEAGSQLAVATGFFLHNRELHIDRASLARAYPQASGRLAVWVHGMGVTEGVFEYPADPARSYAALLEAEQGFTPLFFRYNSGRHVSESGEELAVRLAALVDAFPVRVTEIVLVGYSMGGLVVRSALHAAASAAWLGLVSHTFHLGVPHLGAPLERLGSAVSWLLGSIPTRATRRLAALADLRSSGVKDLGRGRFLREHWADVEPHPILEPSPGPMPLPPGIHHHFLVGTLARKEARLLTRFIGDGLVPVGSASGLGAPGEGLAIFPGLGHLDLAHSDEVWAYVSKACEQDRGGAR